MVVSGNLVGNPLVLWVGTVAYLDISLMLFTTIGCLRLLELAGIAPTSLASAVGSVLWVRCQRKIPWPCLPSDPWLSNVVHRNSRTLSIYILFIWRQ